LSPMEYLSDEFYELQNQPEVTGNFTSQVKLYFKDEKLYFVQRPEHLKHEHPGSPINKVVFVH
jgi:hypothetical protein